MVSEALPNAGWRRGRTPSLCLKHTHWIRSRLYAATPTPVEGSEAAARSSHTKEKARSRGLFRTRFRSVERPDVRRLIPLRTRRYLERDLLVVSQALVAFTLNRRKVREQILAAGVGGDKAEPFAVVEPFHCTCTHVCCPLKCEWRACARVPELQGRETKT